MSEELTREVLEDMAECDNRSCTCCKGGCEDWAHGISSLARLLLAEMDKSKVWDGAPDNAGFASVNFCKESGVPLQFGKTMFYSRTPPKSRIDEIAEEAREKLRDYLFVKDGQESSVVDNIIKSAILEDREEREVNQ